jgi:hypothetical protein
MGPLKVEVQLPFFFFFFFFFLLVIYVGCLISDWIWIFTFAEDEVEILFEMMDRRGVGPGNGWP